MSKTEHNSPKLFDYRKYPFSHTDRSANKVSQIRQVIPGDFRARSLLDVGCNAALVTSSIAEQVKASTVHGVELSDEAVIQAKKALASYVDGKVFQTDFNEFSPEQLYDLIMFIDVIEHLEDPVATLRRASEIASFAVVRTPLEDSAVNRLNRRFLGRDFYKIMEDRYGHIQHFSADTIRQTIEDGGFQIINDATFRISPQAQILGTTGHRLGEQAVWNVARTQYPHLWGGSYITFCKSTGKRVINPETYQKIKAALSDEFGDDNLVSVILFGSTTGDTSRRYSDYDFAVILKDLPKDILERETASPRLKRRLRDLDVSELSAFNLYTRSEYLSADQRRSWLIETMKASPRILHDTEGFAKRSLSRKKEEIEKVGQYAWKGIDVEDSEVFLEAAERHFRAAEVLKEIDPLIASYHQTEGQRGLLIAKLYEHGIYMTRGSLLSLGKILKYRFNEDIDLSALQAQDFQHEVDEKRVLYSYDSEERNLTAARALEANGQNIEALFHTYYALKNRYLGILHQYGIYAFDGEISQLFLREFADQLPLTLVDQIYSNSFKAEQILGRGGYASFDLNEDGKPVYLAGSSSEFNYGELMARLRGVLSRLDGAIAPLAESTGPQISVVIATYNRKEYLEGCLRSLNKLIIPRNMVEIVVIDDGSKVVLDQEELQALSEFNLRYVKKEHSGICATKNRGIEVSKGEYVAFLDDDMVVSPFWLVNLMSGFRDERVAGVGATNLTFPDSNPLTQYSDYRELLRAPFRDKTGQILNVITCSAVIRKSVLEEVDGFNKRQSELGVNFGGDDVDLTWKIRNLGYQLNHAGDAISFHNHRNSYRALVRQHIGYGEGTMFHCIDKQRNPAELGIPEPTYSAVALDLIHYAMHEVPKRVMNCYKDNLGLKRSIQYPLLDFSRRFFYNIGILKARKYIR